MGKYASVLVVTDEEGNDFYNVVCANPTFAGMYSISALWYGSREEAQDYADELEQAWVKRGERIRQEKAEPSRWRRFKMRLGIA